MACADYACVRTVLNYWGLIGWDPGGGAVTDKLEGTAIGPCLPQLHSSAGADGAGPAGRRRRRRHRLIAMDRRAPPPCVAMEKGQSPNMWMQRYRGGIRVDTVTAASSCGSRGTAGGLHATPITCMRAGVPVHEFTYLLMGPSLQRNLDNSV